MILHQIRGILVDFEATDELEDEPVIDESAQVDHPPVPDEGDGQAA